MRIPMSQLAVRVSFLFLALVPATASCFGQMGGYLTAQEEAVCKKDFKIREGPDNSEISLRSFSWSCSQALLRQQKLAFAAFRRSMHSRSGEEATAYEFLVTAFLNFHTKLLDYSTRSCGGGNGCVVDSAMDEVQDYRDFLAITEKIKDGTFPTLTPADFSAADDLLNNKYRDALKSNACPEVMIETRPCDEDLRLVERAWLRYRDAWVTAAAVLWPQVDSESLRTLLTRQRILGIR